MNGSSQQPSEPTPFGRDTGATPLEQLDERLKELCRDYPLAMLGGAAVIGFVLARIITR